MNEEKLLHVFTYNDLDREFWDEHLESWVPKRLIDSHIHIADPRFQIEQITEEMRRSYWVMEVDAVMDAETTERSFKTVFPGREVSCVGFGMPMLGFEIEGSNEYSWTELPKRGWDALAMVRPTWRAEQVDWLLSHPGVIGVKPYYALIGHDATTRDRYIECSIFDMLPHHQLEVLNQRKSWVTLHVPRAGRLAHPKNIAEIKEIRKRYPDVRLVIAHLGRSYTLPHAEEGLLPLADDPGIYFDTSAVLNPEVLALALKHIGPDRILYGTDNPIFFMRGRRQWQDRTYINRTSHPFHFNTNRESPEIEAKYTIYMYEALKAFKDVCEEAGVDRAGVEKMFSGNVEKLKEKV